MMSTSQVSILGLGWFGAALGLELKQNNMTILGTTRSFQKIDLLKARGFSPFLMTPMNPPDPLLFESDWIILNIPPYLDQLGWFKSFPWKDKNIIFISSTGVISNPESENSKILLEEEDWVKSHFSNWSILRFGGLLGAGRHPGYYLSGKKNISHPYWPINLIHLNDCIEFTKIILEQKIFGKIFQVVSDHHPTRLDFYTQFCQLKGIETPEFDLEDLSQNSPINNDLMKQFYNPKMDLLVD